MRSAHTIPALPAEVFVDDAIPLVLTQQGAIIEYLYDLPWRTFSLAHVPRITHPT